MTLIVPKLFEKSIGVVLTLLTSFFVAVFSFCRTTSLSNSPRYVTAEFARQIPKNFSQITSQERLKPLLPKSSWRTANFVVRVVHLQRSIKKCLRRIVPNSTAQQAFFISGRKCATITTKSSVPFQNNSSPGSIVDFDIVVQVAILVLGGV